MRNDYKNSIYNPCEQCDMRKLLHHCSMAKRTMCARFVFGQYIYMIENGNSVVPDEVLVALLRKNGWHGEIRQQTTVRI